MDAAMIVVVDPTINIVRVFLSDYG